MNFCFLSIKTFLQVGFIVSFRFIYQKMLDWLEHTILIFFSNLIFCFLVTFDCFCEFLYLFFCTHVTCDPFSPLNPQIFRMVGKKAARKTCSKWRTQTPLGLSSNIRTVERKSVVWLFWFRNYLATVVKRVPIIWTLIFLFSTFVLIMSFQQGVEFWNWCWISNICYCYLFWLQPSFTIWCTFKVL